MTNHQSKPNNITMHPLIIVTLLVGSVLCIPNQHQRTDNYDKQLLRKALDETNLPRTELNAPTNNTSVINFQCPEQFGYYTDTRDCTKYYVCVFGEVLHESCTGGLRFSRELQTCDWPRNVECPHANTNGSAQTSSTTGGVSSSSSQFATTVATSTISSGNLKQQYQNAKETPADGGGGGGEERTLKGSSMVFADEGSDPQQPSFDEAVSPVITPDGAIHLHDGSGGTFGLTPNHNRQQQEGQNVDIFVKPLLTQPNNNRPRQQQQQQLGNRQTINSKLQPATLPGQQHRNLNMQQINSNNNQLHQTTTIQQLPQTTATTNHHSQHFSNTNKNTNIQLEESGGISGGDEREPNDSISAQADQESSENQDSGGGSESEGESGTEADNDQRQPPSSGSGGYIPPVMAPNAVRQVGTSGSRQSSQLLSINNRQMDSRQSFRPILVSQSNSQQHLQANNNNNDNFSHQRNQATFALQSAHAQQDMNQHHHHHHNRNQQEEVRPLSNVNNNNMRQNSMRQNQTLHQNMNMAAAQNNRQSRMSSNFQQFIPSSSNSESNERPQALHPHQHQQQQSRLLPTDQIMSNNVNFNDSSKLIRTSQFEPLPPDHSIAGNSFPKFPSPSSRSQNVLFSQHPFGFIADTNSNSNSNSNNNNNGPDQSGATSLQFDSVNSRNINENSPHSSSNSNNNTPQLLQQQRRPRPPKRQQIPSGSSTMRRPNQLRPPSSQLIDIDTTTTTSTTTTGQPTTNSFLSPHDASFMESEEPTGPPPITTTGAQSSLLGLSNQAQSRPIVAPTIVNFQQQQPGLLPTSFSPQTTSNVNTPPTTTIGTRRFNNNQDRDQQSNRPLSIQQNPNQGQRSAQLLATTELPLGLITTTTTANTNPTTNSNQEQDPQLVANRYLNSAIDALEAGQPFGTVDYDFDILNDNSTDRRNPTTTTTTSSAAIQVQPLQSNNQTSFNSNPNANRQRQQQQPSSSFSQDDGENISLTNGQPSGSQIGLNLRPQQAGSQPVNGRVRAGSQQGGSLQASTSNRQQPAATSVGQQHFNQQDSFAPNNLPQTTAPSPSASFSSSQQQNSPTKKPRPTNKKISVNHEQALANNRASIEPAKRPEALFATPTALQTATKCDNRVCKLPDCKCGDTLTPGGLDPKVIPQVILLTFDDAVNDLNWEIYEELFTGKTNPNGCPVLATFYVSHEWTDYGQVQTLYSRGHEMASHSVTHSFGEKFSKSQWFKEVNGQREILNMYGGVKMNDVRGMRAPFLQIGGNKMFEMLYDANFTYDSSMPIFENSPPLWPYTLDYQLTHECMITPCPTKSFPGVWEVGMTMWVDLRGGRCSMGDACSNPPDEDGVYEMLMKNFNRHYKSNRAPFGLFYHSAWFNTVHHRRGFLRFMGTVNSLSDVFFVTNWQMLQWMRKPTPLSEINSFEPWQCPAKNDRPPPCFHPSVCNVKSEHGTRFMKTCQPCPANQQYPWVGATGFKSKQAGINGSG